MMTIGYPTKTEFMKYERCRQSGVTNMFDLPVVMKLTGLDRQTIIDIMTNYGALKFAYMTKKR